MKMSYIKSMKPTKFATQIDDKVLQDLKSYANESNQTISRIVTDAVADYLQKIRVRPAFQTAMDEILDEHSELLRRLAK